MVFGAMGLGVFVVFPVMGGCIFTMIMVMVMVVIVRTGVHADRFKMGKKSVGGTRGTVGMLMQGEVKGEKNLLKQQARPRECSKAASPGITLRFFLQLLLSIFRISGSRAPHPGLPKEQDPEFLTSQSSNPTRSLPSFNPKPGLVAFPSSFFSPHMKQCYAQLLRTPPTILPIHLTKKPDPSGLARVGRNRLGV